MTERIEDAAPTDVAAVAREQLKVLEARRKAQARTWQLVEWLGFALVVLAAELAFGVAAGLAAAGVALVVSANAS